MALRAAGSRNDGEGTKKWFAIIVGIIMLTSVMSFVFFFNPSLQGGVNFRFAGLTFEQTPKGIYSVDMGGQKVDFFYRPEDVADMNVSPAVAERLAGSRAAYITYYWNSSMAQEMALFQLDFATILKARHDVYAQPAFTTPSPTGSAVIACINATSFVPVLYLQEANNTAIGFSQSSPGCIILNATSGTAFLRLSDKLKYIVLEAGSG